MRSSATERTGSTVERQDQVDRLRGMVTPERNLIPRLGIMGLDVTPDLAKLIPDLRNPTGVVVAGVALDAQELSGLFAGDVIYGVNGQPVRELTDLRSALSGTTQASTLVLQVGREGQFRYVTVPVGE